MANIFTKAYNALFTWEPATKSVDLLPPAIPIQQWTPYGFPGSRIDYSSLVGDPMRNSIVLSALQWMLDMYPSAPFVVERQNSDGTWVIEEDHPLTALLTTPTSDPDFGADVLFAGLIGSTFLAGDAYWRKIPAKRGGGIAELWHIPTPMLEPDRADGGYTYFHDGKKYALKREEIVHFRDGMPSPNNPRKTVSRMNALYREIYTDNEATNFTATLLRNMGVPGVVISPKDNDVGFGGTPDEETANINAMKQRYQDLTTSDHRGEPLFLTMAMDIATPGFNPEQMHLDAIHDLPEERVAMVARIPSVVLGSGRGLDASTYNNFPAAVRTAVEQNMLPAQQRYARAIQHQLLPDFEPITPRVRCRFNADTLAVMQESQNEKADRAVKLFTGGISMRYDVLKDMGKEATDDDRVYSVPNTITLRRADGTPLVEPTPPQQIAGIGQHMQLNAPYVDAQDTRELA